MPVLARPLLGKALSTPCPDFWRSEDEFCLASLLLLVCSGSICCRLTPSLPRRLTRNGRATSGLLGFLRDLLRNGAQWKRNHPRGTAPGQALTTTEMEKTMDSYASPAPQPRPAEATLLDELVDEVVNPDEIVTEAPAEQFRLGYLDVICLVVNRIIGES